MDKLGQTRLESGGPNSEWNHNMQIGQKTTERETKPTIVSLSKRRPQAPGKNRGKTTGKEQGSI